MTDGQRIPVIIDCDTGVDDALALLFAVRHPALDVRAITCVAGNTDVDGVVRNTLTVLEVAGAGDIPVARGAERPLIEPVRTARHVHGQDGMGDQGLPAPTRVAVDVDAVTLLRREILASPRPVTLIPMAPLTNIALLLRTHPEVTRNIERIVFIGSAVGPRERHPGRRVQRVARPGGRRGPAPRYADHDVRPGRVQEGSGARGGGAAAAVECGAEPADGR
ncbi:Pyrimidine-specific ribonucleoside hydrolase RihA [Streptomyces violarus]